MILHSLDLNWVRNTDKSVVVPPVVFEATSEVGGYYVHPFKGERLIGEIHYPGDKGIIVVSSEYPDSIAGTLAHEWRHHWQFFQGWKYDGIGWNNPSDYETAIAQYFTRSRSEMDALLFEMKRSREHHHDFWRSLIVKEQERLCPS